MSVPATVLGEMVQVVGLLLDQGVVTVVIERPGHGGRLALQLAAVGR